MNHTPGPWRVGSCGKHGHDRSRRRELCVCIRDADGHAVARVTDIGDEFEANERLIVAAPGLLAACVAALETFDVNPRYCVVCNHHPDVNGHRDGCAVPIVVAAIALARGGA